MLKLSRSGPKPSATNCKTMWFLNSTETPITIEAKYWSVPHHSDSLVEALPAEALQFPPGVLLDQAAPPQGANLPASGSDVEEILESDPED